MNAPAPADTCRDVVEGTGADGIRRAGDDDGTIVVHRGGREDVVNQLHEVGREALGLIDHGQRVGGATEFLDLVLVVTASKDDPGAIGEDDVACVLLELDVQPSTLADVPEGRPNDVLGCVPCQRDVGNEGELVGFAGVGDLVGKAVRLPCTTRADGSLQLATVLDELNLGFG